MSCHVDTSVDVPGVAETINCFQEQVGSSLRRCPNLPFRHTVNTLWTTEYADKIRGYLVIWMWASSCLTITTGQGLFLFLCGSG